MGFGRSACSPGNFVGSRLREIREHKRWERNCCTDLGDSEGGGSARILGPLHWRKLFTDRA